MRFPRKTCALLLVLSAAARAGALEWPQTTVEAGTEPFQKTLPLVFAFRNGGTKPVHILDLQTSCSCLAATTDKKVYAPGESGKLTARFSVEDRSGLYERSIMVMTDESAPPQRLTVRIEVPELVAITPRSLEWSLRSAPAEKSTELRATGALRISFAQATPSNETFAANLETIVPGRVYRLVVRPLSTATVANAAIRISGHDDSGREILISAYANVR